MKRALFRWIKRIVILLLAAFIGVAATLLVVAVCYLNNQPDLKIWHTAHLDEEFTADSDVDTLEAYMALEDRLFRQLDELVYAKVKPEEEIDICRYTKGSCSDPCVWPRNWNRTFELKTDEPRIGVLLLHGMSDSPYSLRNLGQELHARGAWVVGLRIPGHGTAPSGLTRATWEDMAAATRLGVEHLRKVMGDKPIYIVGYSNGGALAVNYVLKAATDETLPKPAGVILLSPEIGISPAAALASWQARLGRWLGLQKLEWTSVLPEYDPYKYGSFAVNAGVQAYRLTQEIQTQLNELSASGQLEGLPPILAFQSALDATVSAEALVSDLFDRLPTGGHELVFFDLNRITNVLHLLKSDPKVKLKALLAKPGRKYALTLLTNKSQDSRQMVARQKTPGSSELKDTPLELFWPENVYSLSHIALPFPSDDPLYGEKKIPDCPHVQLGNLALRGERNALYISASDMLRQRWNPFYPYLLERVLEFVQLNPQPTSRPSK